MNNEISIGYDDNLGLANDFQTAIGCKVVPYHNLTLMLEDFEKEKLAAIFLPAGTLPYIKEYTILSQAFFGPQNKTTLQTNFVTTQSIKIDDISKHTLGRVNQYCTTSYWAPMIYLMNVLPKDTHLKFQDTNGFPDLLHKTAQDQIACCMIWDIIMQQHPQDSKKVHELFYLDNLPSPVLISKSKFPSDITHKINQFKSKDVKAFFPGFQQPDIKSINQFLNDIQKAREFFNISLT